MFQKETSVKNPTGLHARPASQMVQFCKGFPEKITLVAGERRVDPKSIITILAGGLKQGTSLTVQVEGEHEQEVCEKVVAFIESLED